MRELCGQVMSRETGGGRPLYCIAFAKDKIGQKSVSHLCTMGTQNDSTVADNSLHWSTRRPGWLLERVKEESYSSVPRTKGHSVLLPCQCSDLAVLLVGSQHPFSASYGMQQTALLLPCPLVLLQQAAAQVALSLQHLAGSILKKKRVTTAETKEPLLPLRMLIL